MKILFFNRFFFPDTSATSQIVSDLAFHLAASGREVHVVTSRVPGGEAAVEVVRGVKIHRVATATIVPHGLARRGIAYLQYYLGSRRAARELVAPGDIVVIKTDPPLASSAIGPLAHKLGARVVVWLQDLFPEVAHEYGVPGAGGPTGALLRRTRNRSLAIADRVVPIGEHMAARLEREECVGRDRMEVIHNWADGEAIVPIAHEANDVRRRWNLGEQFVVAYSGNLGRVHEFDTILSAAAKLKSEPRIVFLVVGRGPRLAQVQERVKRDGLSNVLFKEHQERGLLAQSLGAADVHLSVLRPGFEGLVHPSKLYGIMAAGRPTLFVGDLRGETASILEATGAGISVATGDAEGLAKEILAMRDDPTGRAAMGQRARKAFDERYSMPLALARWQALLSKIA
jgi:glycosyltransferase involved in cell wall biosynthesis